MAVGAAQLLIDRIVPLVVPALKVSRIIAQVINLTCQVLPGSVQVSGILQETITQVSLADNRVFEQIAALPFTTIFPVAGAVPGEVCQITRVVIEGITVQFVADQLIREIAIIEIEVQTLPGTVEPPQPVSPLFEARPPGVFVARANGTSFT